MIVKRLTARWLGQWGVMTALAVCCSAGLALAAGDQPQPTKPAAIPSWRVLDQVPEEVWTLPGLMRPDRFMPLEIDVDALQAELRAAPLWTGTNTPADPAAERGGPIEPPGVVINLPDPDGRPRQFRMLETQTMHPDLAAGFPGIRTYSGFNIDDPAEEAAISITDQGLQAQVRSPESLWLIDPLSVGDRLRHASYWSDDSGSPGVAACATTGEPVPVIGPGGDVAQRGGDVGTFASTGPQLITFRIGVATTGEYTARFGGTVSSSLSQVVATLNRVNQIWRAELAIQFQLLANNDTLIFTDANTDPYTNSVNADMLDENQAVFNASIGGTNYDVGHVFGTAGGGVAGLGTGCQFSTKARGVSSNSFSTFTAAQTFAHELGHQFNAPHTFNSIEANTCGPQRSNSGAFEPGSGSTIMSYGGFCGADNLGARADYFHATSFDFILSFLASRTTCGIRASTGNSAPSVRADRDYTIPAGVAFELRATTASDPDGDPITLTWEQRDNGGSTGFALAAGDPGRGPIIRSRFGTSATTRTIPPLSNILNNTSVLGEILPTTNRNLNFRVTARDGRGGVNDDDIRLLARVMPSIFRITSPNSFATFSREMTVTWDTGGTTGTPFGLTSVDILLSTDGGNTFPITLARSVPNSGSATVRLPERTSNTARIRINPVGNIFFDINDANFALTTSTCLTDYNRDGTRNLEDLSDYITDFFANPPIPGGLQPLAPTFADTVVGYGTPCGEIANEAALPYDIEEYRRSGYRVAFSADLSNACPLDFTQTFPNLDHLSDFITAFYATDNSCQ
jgi:hypothetical protein